MRLLSFSAAALMTFGLAPAGAQSLPPLQITPAAVCPASLSGLDATGVVFGCWCPAGGADGSIWGTGVYTHDSEVCTAARHAGAVGTGGGAVMVRTLGGQGSYEASTANGITSGSWGSYGGSIEFVALPWGAQAGAPGDVAGCPENATTVSGTLSCLCPEGIPGGSVWGTGVYTNDSSICGAAIHFGVIGTTGGTVTVVSGGPRDTFEGSSANGVTTMSYGPWGATFTFAK